MTSNVLEVEVEVLGADIREEFLSLLRVVKEEPIERRRGGDFCFDGGVSEGSVDDVVSQ